MPRVRQRQTAAYYRAVMIRAKVDVAGVARRYQRSRRSLAAARHVTDSAWRHLEFSGLVTHAAKCGLAPERPPETDLREQSTSCDVLRASRNALRVLGRDSAERRGQPSGPEQSAG